MKDITSLVIYSSQLRLVQGPKFEVLVLKVKITNYD